MKDLVDAALEKHEGQGHDEAENGEFGEPHTVLIEYGSTEAETITQGWDSRYPHPKYPEADTHRVRSVEDLPNTVTEADYAILTGSTEHHSLAEKIGEKLPQKTTSLAIPTTNSEYSESLEIDAVDATIPCKHSQAQELATDLLTILTGQIQISPPPQLYQELQKAGLMHGFQGHVEHSNSESSPHELAENLVNDALENPLHTRSPEPVESCISFLHAGNDLTLREAEAVRDKIYSKYSSSTELFTADTTEDMENKYRLTLLLS